MRQTRRGCGIATSLALLLSLLPLSPAFALRNAQDEAKTSGLEETLRAATGLEKRAEAAREALEILKTWGQEIQGDAPRAVLLSPGLAWMFRDEFLALGRLLTSAPGGPALRERLVDAHLCFLLAEPVADSWMFDPSVCDQLAKLFPRSTYRTAAEASAALSERSVVFETISPAEAALFPSIRPAPHSVYSAFGAEAVTQRLAGRLTSWHSALVNARSVETESAPRLARALQTLAAPAGLEEGVRTETVPAADAIEQEVSITAQTPPEVFAQHERVRDRNGVEYAVEHVSWTTPDVVLRPLAGSEPTNGLGWATRESLIGRYLIGRRDESVVTALAAIQRDHGEWLANGAPVAELVQTTDRVLAAPASRDTAQTLAWRWEQQAQALWEALVPHPRRSSAPALPDGFSRETALVRARLFSTIARALRAATPASGLEENRLVAQAREIAAAMWQDASVVKAMTQLRAFWSEENVVQQEFRPRAWVHVLTNPSMFEYAPLLLGVGEHIAVLTEDPAIRREMTALLRALPDPAGRFTVGTRAQIIARFPAKDYTVVDVPADTWLFGWYEALQGRVQLNTRLQTKGASDVTGLEPVGLAIRCTRDLLDVLA